MKAMKVKLTFLEELLGTASANPDLVREFIAGKAPEPEMAEEEVAAIPDIEEEMQKAATVFSRNGESPVLTLEDPPHLWDYQIKGFMKDACGMLRRVAKSKSAGLKAYKKVIDGLIFVTPRTIPLALLGDLTWCERPLRADTAQGPRIALARSEAAPPGTTITIEIQYLKDDLIDAIEDWLEYGKLRGLGCWRNSGKGRFSYEVVK